MTDVTLFYTEEVRDLPPVFGPTGRGDFGQPIEVRCWDSIDARIAAPTRLPFEILATHARRMVREVPGVVSVTYNMAAKPPSTMEAVKNRKRGPALRS